MCNIPNSLCTGNLVIMKYLVYAGDACFTLQVILMMIVQGHDPRPEVQPTTRKDQDLVPNKSMNTEDSKVSFRV